MSAGGEIVEEFASPPDGDGLRGLTRRVGSHGLAVRGVIESMTGARFVHDRLEERKQARFRMHLVKHRSMLKHRIHATLISFGHPCPVTDLFGVAGRELLDRLRRRAAVARDRRGEPASHR